MSVPLSFKDYITYVDDEKFRKTKKKLNKKSPKGRYYGGVSGDQSSISEGAIDGMSQSTIPTVWSKKYVNLKPEENEEDETDAKYDPDVEDDAFMDDETDPETEDDSFANDEDDAFMDDEDETEDPNRQGVIRKVTGSHLVYKRQDEEGTYKELWIYKINGPVKDEIEIRKDILAGTDIPQNKTKSKDGTQSYELWTAGNLQWLLVSGMPS